MSNENATLTAEDLGNAMEDVANGVDDGWNIVHDLRTGALRLEPRTNRPPEPGTVPISNYAETAFAAPDPARVIERVFVAATTHPSRLESP